MHLLFTSFFKFGDIPFNYGYFPRTWEDPEHMHPDTKAKGDGDPLDVVEISETPIAFGDAVPVRVLGLLALIDDGETDWKVITIARRHPRSSELKGALKTILLLQLWWWCFFFRSLQNRH